MKAKLKFLIRSALRQFVPARQLCPNCGGEGSFVARKYLVAVLRRCRECQLQYRTPTDRPHEAAEFYDSRYEEGPATILPDEAELDQMKAEGFSSLANDYTSFARLLRDLGAEEGARVFDYGCSWGYGSWLFEQAGFAVTAFEISRQKSDFAKRALGVEAIPDFNAFAAARPEEFDVFFSSHVLEHVPAPGEIIRQGMDLLRPGGLFVAIVPNGTLDYRMADPGSWRQLWGKVHPNFLDDRFFEAAAGDLVRLHASFPVAIGSRARAHLEGNDREALRLNGLTRYELLFAARKPAQV